MKHLWRLRAWTLLPVSIFLLAASSSVGYSPVPIEENFMIAYVGGPSHVIVNYAKVTDRLNWNSGNFPATFQSPFGASLATDQPGLADVVFITNPIPPRVKMVWGLGPLVWDQSSTSAVITSPGSSVVGAPVGANRWLLVYRTANGKLFAGIYDHSTRTIGPNLAPDDALTAQVFGRPTVAASPKKVVVAWQTKSSPSKLVVLPGTISQGNVAFSATRVIPTPLGNGVGAGIQSDPVVARTNGRFYMVALRQFLSTNLSRYGTQVYKSVDGSAWTSGGVMEKLVVKPQTYYGLAGATDGSLIAAAVTPVHSLTQVSAAQYVNGQWQALPDNVVHAMFSTPAAMVPFVMVGNKQNLQ